MYRNLPSGLMSNRPSRFSSRINYALLHSTGTRQPLPAAAAESDSDSDDPTNMSVRSAEANRLPDEIARDVEQLMSLSEEELGQALRQAQEEGAELARRRKAEQVLAARKLNDELRTSSHRGSGRPAAFQRQPARLLTGSTSTHVSALRRTRSPRLETWNFWTMRLTALSDSR